MCIWLSVGTDYKPLSYHPVEKTGMNLNAQDGFDPHGTHMLIKTQRVALDNAKYYKCEIKTTELVK